MKDWKLYRLLVSFLMLSLFVGLTVTVPFIGERDFLGGFTGGHLTTAERLYYDQRASRWDSLFSSGQSPSDEISAHSYARADIVTLSSLFPNARRLSQAAQRGRFASASARPELPLSELVCRKADEFSSFPPSLADYTNVRKRE